ncbi:MAG: hypothetical protein CFE23_11790 [Flavobacterium sp. BFFFF1]|uniref:hypothetical protein n=1 Tax=Flavobacterium sp. BFFFF1 TaxID=2015557 RepID=UPI000BC87693|nr:hypothetical protein [Flavobacterium sp. BFFFF1]OYU79930.1 MAG: hypothetical protein CFE23_11790 [Flavobacterium sp. BFFFF1]
MWIENTINEILQFVKRFFGMFAGSIFWPLKLLRDIRSDQPKLIRASVYFFIALLLYVFYITARMHNVHYIVPTALKNNKVIEIAATDASMNFNFKAFLYVLPVVMLFYLLVKLLIKLVRVPRIEAQYYMRYICIWSASAILLNAVLDMLAMFIKEHPEWIFGDNPTLESLESLRIFVKYGRNIVLCTVVLFCSTYPVVKHYKWALKPLIIPFVAIMSLSFSFQSIQLLYNYFSKPDSGSLSFRSVNPDDFINVIYKKDSVGNKGTATMSFYIFNDSDSTFILPSFSRLLLTRYSKQELKSFDEHREIRMKRINGMQRSMQELELKDGIEGDTLYVIKPKDFRKVTFTSKMDGCYFNAFFDYGPGHKYAELEFFIPVTSSWNQYWPRKTKGQDVGLYPNDLSDGDCPNFKLP